MTRMCLLLLSASLAGCTTLGTNVKGDFACRAPGGTCRPMTAIDAAAVVELGDAASNENSASAKPVSTPRPVGIGVPVRVGERTITIVLPAHVDDAGVLHEAATVHAVVEPSGWATIPPGNTPSSQFSRSSVPSTLREAIAGASAPAVEGLESLPRAPQPITGPSDPAFPAAALPSPAAIAAARAGHRIGLPQAAEPERAAAGAALPRGKVVLGSGDASVASARVKALAAPVLSGAGKTPSAAQDGDPGDPFGVAGKAEQPR